MVNIVNQKVEAIADSTSFLQTDECLAIDLIIADQFLIEC